MKQFLFLCAITLGGGLAGLAAPFWAVLLYYTLAVLRPQYLWKWALPIDVRWSLIAAAAVLGGTLLNFPKIFKRGQFNSTAALMLTYGILVMLSVITAYDPNVAQAWAIDFIKVLLIALIATLVVEHLWQVRLVAAMIGLCLGYIAYEINFLYFMQNARLDVFHQGYGGLDNNGAGLMLAMGLPFAYCFAVLKWKDQPRWVRPLAIVLGVVLLHSVMLTYSRGAMLSAVVGLLWLAWHHRPRWQVATIGPIVFVLMLALAGPEIRKEFISTKDYKQDRSANSRFESWAAAWTIAWEHPVFGTGLRNSNQYSQNYGADMAGRTIHNQYLQIAADSGIITATVYLTLVLGAIWKLGQSRKQALRYREQHGEEDPDDHQFACELSQAGHLCLAVQAGLVIFAFNGIFLSLETFELPWLLLVLAGIMPGVIHRRINTLEGSQEEPQRKPAIEPLPDFYAPPKRYQPRATT